MALIKQYHKDTNTTYVYESESYWDPEKKQSRSHRKVIGKIDPITGETIPTGKRGRKKKESPSPVSQNADAGYKELSALYEKASLEIAQKNRQLSSQRAEIDALKNELSALKARNRILEAVVRKISAVIKGLSE